MSISTGSFHHSHHIHNSGVSWGGALGAPAPRGHLRGAKKKEGKKREKEKKEKEERKEGAKKGKDR